MVKKNNLLIIFFLLSFFACKNDNAAQSIDSYKPEELTANYIEQIKLSFIDSSLDTSLINEFNHLSNMMLSLGFKKLEVSDVQVLENISEKLRASASKIAYPESKTFENFSKVIDSTVKDLKKGEPVGPKYGIIVIQTHEFMSLYAKKFEK